MSYQSSEQVVGSSKRLPNRVHVDGTEDVKILISAPEKGFPISEIKHQMKTNGSGKDLEIGWKSVTAQEDFRPTLGIEVPMPEFGDISLNQCTRLLTWLLNREGRIDRRAA
jgi:hypothetical protein